MHVNRVLAALAAGLVLAGAMLTIPCLAPCAAIAAPAADTQTVVATGAGAVRAGDAAVARDAAIEDALRNAVEQVVGTAISSETMVKNFELVEDRILTKTRGYVKSYKVLEESTNATDQTVQVKVEAVVSASSVVSDLEAIGLILARKHNPRLLVLFEETSGGAPLAGHPAETAATKYFLSLGFTAVDASMVNAIRANESARAALAGNDKAAAEIGLRQGAEVVVLGTAQADPVEGSGLGGLVSSRATVDARAVNVSTGEIIATGSQSAGGADAAANPAAAKAIGTASQKLARELAKGILDRFSADVASTSRVRMVVAGVPDYATLLRLQKALEEEVRGLQQVTIRNFTGGTAELEGAIEGDSQALARELSEKTPGGFTLSVTGVSGDAVEMKFGP